MSKSICVKVCAYEETGRFCVGCGRTPEEITEWFYASQERKKEIVKAVRARSRKDGKESDTKET
jgi:predicted Fe-S protein YdhL (DUF1289 family)